MSDTLTYTNQLTVIDCGECGITYAIPEEWRQQRRRDHKTFYCPNGCHRWYPRGTSDEEVARNEAAELKRRLASERENVRAAQADAEVERNRTRAYKGHATRLRNRVGKGLCPACSEEFPDLETHMHDAHPGYSEADI